MMTKKSLLTICLLAAATLGIWAQGPNGSGTYYIDANGKSGSELKTALKTIISKQSRNPSYDDFLELYKQTDSRPDGKVRDWYSNITNYTHIKDKAGNYQGEGDVYNREHLVPQSWGASKAGDIMYVVPTDGYVNNARSSLPFGEVNPKNITYQSANGYSKKGTCITSGYSGIVFEPNDEVKGDIARIYFYMATRYEDKCLNWSGEMFTGSTKYEPLAQWAYNMLVRWSQLDPIDDVEITRNNTIARSNVQGNRNPFVDYPGLEEYIWGSKKNIPFSYDNYEGSTPIIEQVADPIFTPEGGTFTNSVEVAITTDPEDATIYYTTDGSEPTENDNVYSGPLTFTTTTTLKALAVKEGLANSKVQTAKYIINNGQTGEETEEEVTIALNNIFFGTTITGSISGNAMGDFTGTTDGITVTYSKSSGTYQYMNDSQIRIYSGNTLTVSAEEDITKMEFTLVLNKGDKELQASEGTVDGVKWTGTAQSVVFNVNSGSGHLQLSQLKVTRKVEKPQPKNGDVNGDGVVDVSDIAAIIDAMAENINYTTSSSIKADTNGDGAINVADIAYVITIMAGGATEGTR